MRYYIIYDDVFSCPRGFITRASPLNERVFCVRACMFMCVCVYMNANSSGLSKYTDYIIYRI